MCAGEFLGERLGSCFHVCFFCDQLAAFLVDLSDTVRDALSAGFKVRERVPIAHPKRVSMGDDQKQQREIVTHLRAGRFLELGVGGVREDG